MPQGVEHKVVWHGSGSRWSLGVALALLAGSLLAPTPARAGCGDHVLLTPRMNVPADDASGSLPAQPAKQHVPCSGPNCTRAPIAPAPVPVAPVSFGAPEWACVVAPLALPAANSLPHTLEPLRDHPLSAGSSVYHPPR